ncbi:MAG TPA: ABC transporter ATP-binding protein [Thermomicrobiales bacterium]|nr:ABC transporter ATP-binding protein [Thermomicrobiales bacterium]
MQLGRLINPFQFRRSRSPNGAGTGPAIRIKDVVREYRTGRRVIRALDGVSLVVERGEYVTIVGSSGSGKSTLLNLISGIDVPDAGEVEVLGRKLKGMSENELAAWRGRNVGIVFQFFQLMPTLTVIENVILPMDLAGNDRDRRARAERLLDQVGILDLADNLPSELSGGEQQRAAIARALANDPELLVADEPTGNLDSVNGRIVMQILEELWRAGTTVLIVTHDRELAARAPRRIAMRDGRIISDEVGVPAIARVGEVMSHADAR